MNNRLSTGAVSLQLPMIDFAGESSLKRWYHTIGKNRWRLEEFQHYYGNDTYDDDVTSDAARFLLKNKFQKKDPRHKAAIDKAINTEVVWYV